MSDERLTTLGSMPWRTGRQVYRTIYDAADRLIGMMDTPELAAQVVAAVNAHSPDGEMRAHPVTA